VACLRTRRGVRCMALASSRRAIGQACALGRARKLRLIGIISQMGSGVRPNHSLNPDAKLPPN